MKIIAVDGYDWFLRDGVLYRHVETDGEPDLTSYKWEKVLDEFDPVPPNLLSICYLLDENR